ncbi:MAG: 3-methyl-2-oxobutanoate hydroxymethyltransferase [Candidatus Eremiobacteraeota bacterium]|nr:3-methyl-2-oxobutanoate hydroxymethyltransferase [Candidatus Eremiobacteraeota bacterium]
MGNTLLGLTPQSVHAFGGFKVQAKEARAQQKLLKDAKDLQEAGCFALVLECVPSQIAKEVTDSLDIPTIGIGAGPHCDGQVLVLQDMLGAQTQFKPKFVRHFADLSTTIKTAVQQFTQEVQDGTFPSPQESYA